MNDDSRAVAENFGYTVSEYSAPEARPVALKVAPPIPDYLQDTYWWAYLHPKALHFFEREWVVNLILWGNMRRLTRAVLDELTVEPSSRVLQVACVYGEFSNLLASHLAASKSRLDLVDVAPIQLKNAREKLAGQNNVSYHHQDSSALTFPAGQFDQTVVFFLLHEQPEEVRRKTIAEAIRVTRPGGKVIFVDYHGPKRRNPFLAGTLCDGPLARASARLHAQDGAPGAAYFRILLRRPVPEGRSDRLISAPEKGQAAY